MRSFGSCPCRRIGVVIFRPPPGSCQPVQSQIPLQIPQSLEKSECFWCSSSLSHAKNIHFFNPRCVCVWGGDVLQSNLQGSPNPPDFTSWQDPPGGEKSTHFPATLMFRITLLLFLLSLPFKGTGALLKKWDCNPLLESLCCQLVYFDPKLGSPTQVSANEEAQNRISPSHGKGLKGPLGCLAQCCFATYGCRYLCLYNHFQHQDTLLTILVCCNTLEVMTGSDAVARSDITNLECKPNPRSPKGSVIQHAA